MAIFSTFYKEFGLDPRPRSSKTAPDRMLRKILETKTVNEQVEIALEFTPNPNSLKYVVNRALIPRGAFHFKSQEEATSSALAAKLFEKAAGLAGVTVGKNFVTITKKDEAEWDQVHGTCHEVMQTHFNDGLEVVSPSLLETPILSTKEVSELEKKIIAIIDQEIRPAVAVDGGDVVFEKFENGTVFLHMEGACSGCPSSSMTLKMGIETRLKELFPEVQEVTAI